MRARTRINIGLIGGVLVVGLLIVLVLREDYRGDPMLDIDPGQVRELSSQQDGTELWHMRRTDEGWELYSPLRAPADRHRMEQLLPLLRAPVHSRYPVSEIDPARFGLDEPTLVIRADDHEVAFAEMEGPDRRRYARVDDEILVIDDMVYFRFGQSAEHFLERQLLSRDRAIEAIEFPGTRLQRGAGGRWQLEPPAGEGEREAGELVREWRQARADSVAAWPAPLEEALLIRVHFRDGGTRVLYLLEADRRLLLGDLERGLLYEFNQARVDRMLPGGKG